MIQKCTLGILVPVYLINTICTIIVPVHVWIEILMPVIHIQDSYDMRRENFTYFPNAYILGTIVVQ